jgi:hypothetical protein
LTLSDYELLMKHFATEVAKQRITLWRYLNYESRKVGSVKMSSEIYVWLPVHLALHLYNKPTRHTVHHCTGLFEMIVGVLTTCHTQYT